jgi:hypothetical protein
MDRKNIRLVSFDDAVAPWPYKEAFGEPLQTPNLDRLSAVSKRDPDRAIASFYNESATIRKGRHRTIRYGDGSCQLFDCIEDYWQLRNLGPEHQAFAGMQAALVAAAADYGFGLSRTVIPAGPDAGDDGL